MRYPNCAGVAAFIARVSLRSGGELSTDRERNLHNLVRQRPRILRRIEIERLANIIARQVFNDRWHNQFVDARRPTIVGRKSERAIKHIEFDCARYVRALWVSDSQHALRNRMIERLIKFDCNW